MSAWLDQKYMDIVSRHLTLPKKTSMNSVYARCPVCGDSQKNQYKRRFGIAIKPTGGVCGCFNCNYTAPLWKFLKEYYPDIYKDYQVESFLEKEQTKPEPIKISEPIRSTKLFTPKVEQIKSVKPASEVQECVTYLTRRAIPQKHWKKFIYVENFKEFGEKIGFSGSDTLEEEPRLVMPLFSNGKLIGVQGRALTTTSKMRYITIRLSEEAVMFIDDVNLEKDIYVFEGVYDALMVTNGVASLSSNLMRVSNTLPKDQLILCFDNEPRNISIVNNIKQSLLKGFRTFIPDSRMIHKDINEMVMTGIWSHQEAEQYIIDNTYTTSKGLLYLTKWKKT